MKILIIPLMLFAFNASATTKIISPSDAYTVHNDLDNFKVKVIEWIPKGNPNVRCIFTWNMGMYSGTACYNIIKPAPNFFSR